MFSLDCRPFNPLSPPLRLNGTAIIKKNRLTRTQFRNQYNYNIFEHFREISTIFGYVKRIPKVCKI